MAKSADAFRTISEVADWLETPAHVLRFWESKFSQVKPVKRAGGRRYYRPADMELLGGIKKLLHDDGMTIKGVQKVLREQGVKHVTALSPPLEPGLESYIEAESPEVAQDVPPAEAARIVDVQPEIEAGEPPATPTPEFTPAPTAEPVMTAGSDTDTMDAPAPETQALADAEAESADAPDAGFDGADADAAQATAEEAAAPVMPSFSHRRTESDTTPQETPEPSAKSDAEEDIAQTSPAPAPLKPADVSVADDPSDSIDAGTGLLTRLSTCNATISPDKRERIQTLMDRLREVSSRSAHGR